MSNLLQKVEQKQIERLMQGREIPQFKAGDTLRISLKIVEGERVRNQMFEGICIGRRNRGLGSSFRVRKISDGEGVERIFPLYAPNITNIEVLKRGRVRRAKLYYLRALSGKAARIKELRDYNVKS